MESLPLKELDFGLQKRTVASSGVVASIVLVSLGLDSLLGSPILGRPKLSDSIAVEEAAKNIPKNFYWSLKCNEFYFHELENCLYSVEHIISHVQHIFFISSEYPFHTLITEVYDISSIIGERAKRVRHPLLLPIEKIL